MRAIIQRVSSASVEIDNNITAQIDKGFLILLGIESDDTPEDITWLTNKIAKMRVFADDQDLMNLSLTDIDGETLVVSQFTLHASTKKGNRPSFIRAARPKIAIPLYEKFLAELNSATGKPPLSGEFGADMKVSLINDGPVTIPIDTKDRQ